jgi:hypothetical protein
MAFCGVSRFGSERTSNRERATNNDGVDRGELNPSGEPKATLTN